MTPCVRYYRWKDKVFPGVVWENTSACRDYIECMFGIRPGPKTAAPKEGYLMPAGDVFNSVVLRTVGGLFWVNRRDLTLMPNDGTDYSYDH